MRIAAIITDIIFPITIESLKKLAFKTPNEVFFNTIERLTVALRT